MNNIFLLMIATIVIGITAEVIFTAIHHFIKRRNVKLQGETYLWMIPIYAVVPLIYFFVLGLGINSLGMRGFLYVIGFYLLEFIAGYIIKKSVGKCPWEYKPFFVRIFHKKLNLDPEGLINLAYFPFWYVFGIIGEFLYLYLINF